MLVKRVLNVVYLIKYARVFFVLSVVMVSYNHQFLNGFILSICPCLPWLLPQRRGYRMTTPETVKWSNHEGYELQWRHNERDGVSNHQPNDYLLNRLFRRRSKKTRKLCVTGLCEGISPVTGEFPAQRARNAENVSIWWRHHAHGSFTKICQSQNTTEQNKTRAVCTIFMCCAHKTHPELKSSEVINLSSRPLTTQPFF